jgi:HPt (histidine-containing phosphotransfer) domain-containing protein
MAYDPGAIDATLAAAVGDEPALIAELRQAFSDSARKTLAVMEAATSQDDWLAATARLRGLAASFGAVRLMALAEQAGEGPAHDPRIIGKLHRMIARF